MSRLKKVSKAPKSNNNPMEDKVDSSPSPLTNRLLIPLKLQYKGVRLAILVIIRGNISRGTQIPPKAARITTETAPIGIAWLAVLKAEPIKNP